MKMYEKAYCMLRFLEHPLYIQINQLLKRIIKPETLLLDVGGRNSPQTIGLNCYVYISELPRKSDIQKKLSLGLDEQLEKRLKRRRHNIVAILYDNMVYSKLKDNFFDIITAIEVLEHVEQDKNFLRNVALKLKENGVFIMSTPNGDYIPNNNPDHKRHYQKTELEDLLSEYFNSVSVFYSVVYEPYFKIAMLLHEKFGKPANILFAGVFFFLSRLQSNKESVKLTSQGTCHLLAICKKNEVHLPEIMQGNFDTSNSHTYKATGSSK